jgi:hypothetical protein
VRTIRGQRRAHYRRSRAEKFDPTPPGPFAGDPPPEFVLLLKEMFAAVRRESLRTLLLVMAEADQRDLLPRIAVHHARSTTNTCMAWACTLALLGGCAEWRGGAAASIAAVPGVGAARAPCGGPGRYATLVSTRAPRSVEMSTPQAVRAAIAALVSALTLLLGAGTASAATDHVVITGGAVVPTGQTAGDIVVLDGTVRIAGHATVSASLLPFTKAAVCAHWAPRQLPRGSAEERQAARVAPASAVQDA